MVTESKYGFDDRPNYVYINVADSLTARMADEQLPPKSRLPSERRLAKEYAIAVQTLRHAMKILRDRGLVVTLPRKGNYVAEQAPSLASALRR